MITLYGGPTPNARKIAIALGEMGLGWLLETIDILAGDLIRHNRWDALGKLIETHEAKHKSDPFVSFYRGQKLAHDKQWSKSAAAFAKALKLVKPDQADRVRPQLVFARYQAGEAMRAYREIAPVEQTFAQLANQFAQDVRFQGRAVQNLLRFIWFHGGGALKLERSAESICNQKSANETTFRVLDRRQEAQPKLVVIPVRHAAFLDRSKYVAAQSRVAANRFISGCLFV